MSWLIQTARLYTALRGVCYSPPPMTARTAPMATPWLTTEEAAEYLRVSRYTIDRMCRAGRLHFARPGTKDRRFRREWLDAAMEPANSDDGTA